MAANRRERSTNRLKWSFASSTNTKSAERGGDDNSERHTIKLSSLQGESGAALASDDLQDAIRQLYLLHRSHGTGMRVARYFVEPDGSEWRLVSEFEYDD